MFVGADVADGLREEWKRPMHWAGFLVVQAGRKECRCSPRIGREAHIDPRFECGGGSTLPESLFTRLWDGFTSLIANYIPEAFYSNNIYLRIHI